MNKKAIIFFICFFIYFLLTPFCVYADDDSRFRFAVMGCMHFGVSDPQDYKLAVEKIKQYNPDFVLFVGGMVDVVGGRFDAGYRYSEKNIFEKNKKLTSADMESFWQEFDGKEGYGYSLQKAFKKDIKLSSTAIESLWQEFNRITDELGVPVYDVTSERCIPANNVALAEKHFLKRYKKRYYSFEYKNNLFICLDSQFHNSTDLSKAGLIDGVQLDFLKNSIANSSRYDNVFIAMHNAVWLPSFSAIIGDSRWYDTVHPLINKKAKYIFGAYHHILNFMQVDEVTYITTTAWPGQSSPKPDPSFPHFLIVDVNKKKVFIKVVPLNPILIKEVAGLEQKSKEYVKSWYLRRLALPERIAVFQIPEVIKILKIKPGMNILDIGPGLGIFTFPFAEALKGTGRVFAADVEPNMIEFISGKIKEEGYKNIFPVLVKGKGLDPFYKQHSFDIIFLCNVYEHIWNREGYFKDLRPSLKDDGRLYILSYKYNNVCFGSFEFGDVKKIIEILVSKGGDFPVFQRLSKEVRYFIKNSRWKDDKDIPSAIRISIIEDFNKMLSDRLLFNDLVNYYTLKQGGDAAVLGKFLNPLDRRLVQWLAAQLDDNGVLDRQERDISDIDRKRLHTLNKRSLSGIFGLERANELFGIDFPIYLEKTSTVSEMEAAGYRFICEYDFLEYHDLLEFSKEY